MFKLFRNFTVRDYIFILFAIILIVVQVWLDLKLPDYMSQITVLVQTEGSEMSEILENGGWMLACAGGSLIAAVIVGYLMANLSAHFSLTTRKKVFHKINSLGQGEIDKFSTASLITRSTNDITQIEMFIAMGLQMLIKAPITAVWAVTKILNKSWEWSAITAVAVVILLATVISLMIVVIPRFKILQKLTDRINGVTRENITGIRVVRAFNAEEYQEKKFDKVNSKLTGTQLFNQRALSIMSPMMYLVMYFLTLAIYFVGAHLIDDANLQDRLPLFGDMVVFSSYAMQVIMSFLMLAMIFMILPRAQVSAGRLNEVLDTEPSITDGPQDITRTPEQGTVEFRHVSFKYPGAESYLLRDISFKAKQGQTVAFIGSTGSGKSTLINLIPRFYDATDGEVLVDGINVKEYTLESLHNRLGYVPQKAVIFDDTVANNISYGASNKKITKKKIRAALQVAQAAEFVEKMPQGIDTKLAQGGTNISGGQKQRLAIARAIARDPEIYIFDDSFSALDYKTDATLRQELKQHTSNATSLIVAQRIGTIMQADQIIVLDRGECVGQGTHSELLESCPVYREIAKSQLSEQELKGGK